MTEPSAQGNQDIKPSAQEKEFDVIVWGASGFVGKLICEYLVTQYPQTTGVRWAMGGRNKAKLEQLQQQLGQAAAEIPLVVADASDASAMTTMVQRTKVILTTVGPYAQYGTPLLQACAEQGTDYVDLTGEPQWIRRMIDAHQATAEKSGARIVPCCGFDSIPSDLGTFFLNQQAEAQAGSPCSTVKMRVKDLKGGASGGTIASIINLIEEAKADRSIARTLRNPYALNPEDQRQGPPQPSEFPVSNDTDFNSWIAPFIMAGINSKVVRRTHALLNQRYGSHFVYDEAVLIKPGFKGRLKAYGLAAGISLFMLGASMDWSRNLLKKHVLPKPGEGPSRHARENGYYTLLFHGTTAQGRVFQARVTGDKDPGYGSTAKMITESALCLAFDIPKDAKGGGLWTPASAMGSTLQARLEDKAGLTFEML